MYEGHQTCPSTEIKEIIDLSQQGDSTIARRLEIMTAQRDAIREQIAPPRLPP